jgi:hypothetical protein
MATYSFNLLLLTLACGGELRASDLFTRTDDPAAWLRNSALQWQAAVPGDMWMDAMEVIRVTRTWRDGRRDVVLEYVRAGMPDVPDPTDVYWLSGPGTVPASDTAFRAPFDIPPALRSMHLSNRLSDDVLLHALEPLLHEAPAALTHFVARNDDGHSSVAQSLIRMWLAVPQARTSHDLIETYLDAARAATDLFGSDLVEESGFVAETVLGAMRSDAFRLPAQTVCEIVERLAYEAIVTPDAVASAVYCLTVSGAIGDSLGADLVYRFTRAQPDNMDARILIPAVRALLAGGKRSDPADLRRLAGSLIEAGRRAELERADPTLAETLFAHL